MASSASLQHDSFMPRSPAGLGRGLAFAVVAHLLLVAALSFGVSWNTSPPEGIEAELWAAVPQMAAPRAVEPEPPPKPEPRVEPPPAPPKPPVVQPEPDAQIAIEKAKKKKELADKEAEKAREADKLADQKRKDEADNKRREELDKKKADAALAAAREKQMQRMAGLAGATGAPTATGGAVQSAGPSADYIGRIKGRIRPNVSFPDTLPGNPAVEIDIRLAPDGRIVSSRIIKRSGVPEWDAAVLRAIERTEVLPRDENGKVPSAMTIVYRPRD